MRILVIIDKKRIFCLNYFYELTEREMYGMGIGGSYI